MAKHFVARQLGYLQQIFSPVSNEWQSIFLLDYQANSNNPSLSLLDYQANSNNQSLWLLDYKANSNNENLLVAGLLGY